MALPIAPTPVLEGEDAIRFMKHIEWGLKNPVGPVPTPKLKNGIKKIKAHIEWKKQNGLYE